MIQKPKFDLQILKKYPSPYIGVDEVGRGCLAGPVCAGVVILRDDQPSDHFQDSKTLSEEKRRALSLEIQQNHFFALGWASVDEIDQINIRQATFLAMSRAVQSLENQLSRESSREIHQGSLLIDGRDRLPDLHQYHQLAIIKGDQHMRCISAASIVAKVARDQLMIEIAKEYPGYGFEKHKGYGTKEHLKALKDLKPCKHHRKTFGGVKELIS